MKADKIAIRYKNVLESIAIFRNKILGEVSQGLDQTQIIQHLNTLKTAVDFEYQRMIGDAVKAEKPRPAKKIIDQLAHDGRLTPDLLKEIRLLSKS